MENILNKGNVIYAYKRADNQKIVYIGQTTQLDVRHKQHIQYDPFNINTKEYDYPLSRGVRKYGEDFYQLIILEDNIDKNKLGDREKYWIAYYDTYFHGYNQTPGGENPTFLTYTEDIIDLVIEMLKDYNYSYDDISKKTNLSLTHIYNINIGKRRKRDNIEYPIRPSNTKGTKGLKFSLEECEEIHKYILNNPEKTLAEIAEKYNCTPTTIRRINQGKTETYRLKGYVYPLRKTNTRKKDQFKPVSTIS